MKKIFLLLTMVAAVMVGCKNDLSNHPHIDLEETTAPTVTPAQQNVITLTKPTAESLVTFAWAKADYGYSAAVQYVVQMDRADGAFDKPVELGVVNDTKLSVKASVLNGLIVNQLGYEAETMAGIKIRVGSFISDKIDKKFSEEANYLVNTYQSVIIYPSLGIPGNYKAGLGDENWAPENMKTRVYSVNFDNKYEGFVMMQTTDPANKGLEFKFVDGNKWGDPEFVCPPPTFENGTYIGTFVEGMGGNISGVKSAFYKINVDAAADPKTLAMTEIKAVGITGACTTPEWSNAEPVALTYNFENYYWEAEIDLKAGNGEFLVLLNNSWDQKYGKGAQGNQLKAGGDNAVGPTDGGKFRVIVDFSDVVPTFEYIPL